MMRRAGQHERDSGVDGEGGSAFGGSARPGASLGGALPSIAVFLREREFLFERIGFLCGQLNLLF